MAGKVTSGQANVHFPIINLSRNLFFLTLMEIQGVGQAQAPPPSFAAGVCPQQPYMPIPRRPLKTSKTNISQGSVATRFRCGGIFSDRFIANLHEIVSIKEFGISVNIR